MPRPLLVSLALSGAAALVYEIVWVRLLGEVFGATAYAVYVVLAVFFAGMAAGSVLSDRLRVDGGRALLAYAGLEAAVAICGVSFPAAVHLVAPLYDRFAPLELEGVGATIWRLAMGAIVLAPPTAAMGASFPLIVRWLWSTQGSRSALGSLYAANTLGGAAGAWASSFVLIPAFGVRRTLAAAAAANAVAAALALRLRTPARPAVEAPVQAGAEEPLAPRPAVAFLLFVTGVVAIALEVLWTRALDQVLSGTIYSFATVLSVFLVGIALGGYAHGRWLARLPALAVLAGLELLLANSVIASLFLIRLVPALSRWLSSVLGAGFLQRGVFMESLVSGALLLLPAACMGAIFPSLLDLTASRPGGPVGANTAGALAGSLVSALVLLPAAGLRGSLLMVAAVCVSVGVALSVVGQIPHRVKILPATAALTAALVAVAPHDVRQWDRTEERLIDHREDPAATVSVVEDSRRPRERRLKVNNTYFLGGGLGVASERRQGHVAMLLHPSPSRVLVLGVGTADTLGAVALHRPQSLLAVELLPGVLEMARRHFGGTNERVLDEANVHALAADALRVVRGSTESYDLVLGDLFHPWQRGVGALYSREHFEAVRRRLAGGGVFCQWLSLYQTSTDDLRTITRTFLRVYPVVTGWLGNFGTEIPLLALVGSERPVELQWGRWQSALADPRLRSSLTSAGLDTGWELTGSYVADRQKLERFAGSGPINTLDAALVELHAPRVLFAERFHASMVATLRALVQPEEPPAAPIAPQAGLPERAVIDANARAAQWMLLARLAMDEDQARAALEAALRSVRAARGYEAPALALRSIAWAARGREPVLASEAFDEVLRRLPDDTTALFGLGETSLVLRRADAAERAFRRALELRPGWPVAKTGLAWAEALRRSSSGAREAR
jgi:spermidine synthase